MFQPGLIRTHTDIDWSVAAVWQVVNQGSQLHPYIRRFGMDKRSKNNSVDSVSDADVALHTVITHPTDRNFWLRFHGLQERRHDLVIEILYRWHMHRLDARPLKRFTGFGYVRDIPHPLPGIH